MINLKLVYPKWRKLERQTVFHLPPHGPVVFAATLPEDRVNVDFIDENVDTLNFDDKPDIVALSIMLTSQLPRAFEIADKFRAAGITVIAGGISVMLHHEDVAKHVDSVFIGEAEGRMKAVLDDFENNALKPVYNYQQNFPLIENIGTARRSILKREKYNYRGVQMLDLVHASRGCRFKCFPCCTGYLGGKQFRPRPVKNFIKELEEIENNRLFIVDNSLAQDKKWEEELFTAMKPLKKKWVSHPIEDDDKILKLAYDAGAWYVYQAIFDTSDYIRDRVKRYHDNGIGVEGTIILGTDNQDSDSIKRLVDFLLEIKLDTAEFTIMTPFAHSPVRKQLMDEKRIISNDYASYTCDRVVFQPKQMTPEELQNMYYYAWDNFYKDEPQEVKMGNLFKNIIEREMRDGTYVRPTLSTQARNKRVKSYIASKK